jgi:hypothetical protein
MVIFIWFKILINVCDYVFIHWDIRLPRVPCTQQQAPPPLSPVLLRIAFDISIACFVTSVVWN